MSRRGSLRRKARNLRRGPCRLLDDHGRRTPTETETILLRSFEEGGRGTVFYAPLDGILAEDDAVRPDLVVVRDPAHLSSRGIEGVPLLLVEVISPGRAHYDRTVKAQRYAARGVPHYWIVDPPARRLECFRLDEGRYTLQATGAGIEVVEVPDFPGLRIPLTTLWFSPVAATDGGGVDPEFAPA